MNKFKRSDLLPYWSKQHGAYITLITSWLIAVIVSERFIWLQFVILVFILSGLNFSELIAEKFKRATPLPPTKSNWLKIYGGIILLAGLNIFYRHPSIVLFLPVFIAGIVLFTILSYQRLQKSVLSEWIIFAMFALAGLLAYIPAIETDKKTFAELLLMMSFYFGVTIFTVKARLKKISRYGAPLYALFTSLFLLIMYGSKAIVISIVILILLKSLQVIIFRESYDRLELKTIGIIETMFHIVFILIFIYEII